MNMLSCLATPEICEPDMSANSRQMILIARELAEDAVLPKPLAPIRRVCDGVLSVDAP
jgi:hypothetical protein